LAAELPVEAHIVQAPTIAREVLEDHVELSGLPVRIVAEDRFRAIADSHLALCASGTATLEVGLLGTPMVMVYRLASWTYVFAKLMVRLRDVSLVNLVLGKRVVPELIQGDANPERIAAEAARLLTDAAARNEMRAGLAELRERLGEGGATGRAAAEVAAMLAEAARN
ncbi:MAG TPA: lipid-A-disaccharide synthase, partial [Thermoanaerobaculia bacterium]